MKKYELSKEWMQQNDVKVKQGYGVALSQNYDISSLDDVLKLLQIVDPENASHENAEVFSQVLLLFEHQLGDALRKHRKTKERSVN